MGSDRISTKIFSGFVGSTDVIVENGLPIIVDGFIINNQNGFFGRWFKITNTKGNTVLDLYIPAGGVVIYNSSFLADFGLIVKAGETVVSYTIFYKGSG